MPEPPLILVTNDDGLDSPGLHAAAAAVADLGEVLLVAPATQQTAMSRAFVTDAAAGVVKRAEMHIGGRSVSGYAITGSPVMAVTHAVLELAGRPIALCVSGINYGENIGGAIGVSGTVGAAFEADAHGRPLDQPYQFPVEVVVDRDRLEPGTDIHAIVCDRVASVTPLTWQMTAQTDWVPPAGTGEA